MSLTAGKQLLLTSAAGSSAYQISRSLRFSAPDSSFLSRTPASAGNRKTWTWAGWVKRSALATGARQSLFSSTGASDSDWCEFGFEAGLFYITTFNDTNYSSSVYRDTSAWYHVVIAFDTTLATASDRAIIWVNNVRMPITVGIFSQNTDYGINRAAAHNIGNSTFASRYFNGYLADIHFIDGQALDPSSFTTTDLTTGQLIPKAYTGSYGTNGFKLNFSDNSTTAALGTDTSGNGNTWTVNNLSVTAGSGNDSLVDSPTNYGTDTGAGGEVRGNYCTWNPLAGSTATLSDGNLKRGGSGGNRMGTFGMSSGKWYWEIVANSVTGGVFNGITEYSNEPSLYGLNYMYVASTGDKYIGTTPSAYANAYGVGDVIGFAYDADNGSLVCYKNGVSQGVLISGLAGRTLFPLCRSDSSAEMVANFGQRAFAYTAPSGFKALVDTNLPSPPVAKPNTVMDTVLYTGNGAARSITGLSFNPDLVWLKSRSAATDHELTDSVRGVTKSLVSNSTAAEATDTNGLTAFNSDGFSLGTDTNYNNNAATYVAWAWDAGTSTVTNTAGSITSQVRANPSAGFSIVSWTGPGSGTSTVGHGLGVIPGMVFVKARSSSPVGNWWVTHSAMNQSNPPSGFSDYLVLNDNTAKVPGTYDVFRPHTSSVISLGSDGVVSSSSTYVAYCFAPVSGYSSFGSYTGNGSADGPFVYTGFRPRWIMIKSSSSGNWHVLDSARDTYNAATARLFPNLSNAEQTGSTDIDFTSTGFKLRNNISGFNDSGVTHVFAAFAESPFQYARAR